MMRTPARQFPVGLLAQAQRAVTARGVCLITPAEVMACLRADAAHWERFAAHWDQLCTDSYAEELGTRRLRRYGHLAVRPTERGIRRLDHGGFIQPDGSNPRYLDRIRYFEPLTAEFLDDPLFDRLLIFLGDVAAALDDPPEWSAKVHPFRVIADHAEGQPTPEGLHRDGVTLVGTLLVARHNAAGGRSEVVDPEGRPVLATTLAEPGTLLIGDDRRTLHGVTPIRPVDPDRAAIRDVLVITFAAR